MIIALKIIAIAFSIFLASFGGWMMNSKHSSSRQYVTINAISIVIGLIAALS